MVNSGSIERVMVSLIQRHLKDRLWEEKDRRVSDGGQGDRIGSPALGKLCFHALQLACSSPFHLQPPFSSFRADFRSNNKFISFTSFLPLLSPGRQRLVDLHEFKVNLIHVEFQKSQSYIVRLCLKTRIKNKNNTIGKKTDS